MTVARLQFVLAANADATEAHTTWQTLIAQMAAQPQVLCMQVLQAGMPSDQAALEGDTRQVAQPPTHPALVLWMQPI